MRSTILIHVIRASQLEQHGGPTPGIHFADYSPSGNTRFDGVIVREFGFSQFKLEQHGGPAGEHWVSKLVADHFTLEQKGKEGPWVLKPDSVDHVVVPPDVGTPLIVEAPVLKPVKSKPPPKKQENASTRRTGGIFVLFWGGALAAVLSLV